MLAAEICGGPAYHPTTPGSVDSVGIARGGKGRTDNESRSARRYAVSFPELGHGTNSWFQMDESEPYTPIYENMPQLQDYLKNAYEERKRRLGKAARIFGGAANVFPNMSFQPR